MPYRINNLLTTLLIYMTICGCAPDQSFQEMPTTCLSEQNLSEPASPPAYHTERLSEASCMPMPPQPCPSMGYAYVVQPLFAAVPVIIRSDTSVTYGSVQPIQGTVAASQAEVYSNFSTSTPTTTQPIAPPSLHMVEAEHAATPHSRSEEEWLAILMDAVANKAQCSQETVTALIDDVQKHSFSEAQYLRVLALILQLSPAQARIRYNFLQNVAVAATHAMEHHQESLLVQDYLNLAKLFFYSRLRATATTDSLLRTTLALWATHFQRLLHQRPILTPGDSTVLLCFVHKYHITLEETSVAHLSHIIEKDFKLLTLREVRHLFWLYNQTINISPQLVELMYAALTSDLHDWDKTQQDESSVRDLFFILIAGAKLKWEIDKATEGTITPYTASQQQRFITWLKKIKALPLAQASSGLLSIMHAPEREAGTALPKKPVKRADVPKLRKRNGKETIGRY